MLGGDQGAQLTNFYPLALEPLESVNDPTPPTGPAASDRAITPAAVAADASGGEGIAVAVATAVAEALVTEPGAPAVEEVQVTLKESSEVGPARSTRSANREATPISVVVQTTE